MKTVELLTIREGGTGPCSPGFNTITDKTLSLDPYSRYAVTIIKIKDGYRLVTDEEKTKYSQNTKVMFYNYEAMRWQSVYPTPFWGAGSIYAIPRSGTLKSDPTPIEIAEEKVKEASVLLEQAKAELKQAKKGNKMENATVVHCKKEPFDVYIGRPSKWGNPFSIGKDGTREEVIDKYRNWIMEQPKLLNCVKELEGKILGCWCSPKECHGDVLAELANL